MPPSAEHKAERLMHGRNQAPDIDSEATIDDIQQAYQSGQLTCRMLVQSYLDRIAAYDKQGPALNSIITLNARGARPGRAARRGLQGFRTGGSAARHPVIVKDQADVKGMPTTLGSVLFKDYFPDRDSFVVEKLKKAGAVILGKSALGEMAGGDTHGSSSARRATPTISTAPSAVRPAARRPP